MDQDKNLGGVCCKVKGWRYGGEHNGRKKWEDEEIGGGMFTCCGGEEYTLSLIRIWAE